MAAPSGAESASLIRSERYRAAEELLRNEPWSFQFFQAVRLLSHIMSPRTNVGLFVHPAREVVRFGVHSSTSFPASQIQGMRWDTGGAPVMVVNFMGLTGPSGTLPLYYSELVRERLRAKDSTLLAFLDIFNHRMLSLFYQAWEKYRFTVAYERGERDRLSQHLMDLIGLGTPRLQDRQAVRDDSVLFYSGLFALHTRSAMSLRSILEDFFGVPAEIEQFVGSWHALSTPDQCIFEDANDYSEQLGTGAVVGDEIWDLQSRVRVRLGPLPLDRYMSFLPEGDAYQPLRALLRFFAGDELDFEIQLILQRDEVPACELTDVPEGGVRPQLGWSTWVKTAPMGRDPGDAILRI